MKTDTIPPFLSIPQAAKFSGYGEDDIQIAIAFGDLQAADPTGKGLRIPRHSFEEWMSGACLPPWEGKPGDWIECPLYIAMGAINYTGHPSDFYGSWVEHDQILRLRVHTTEDKLEVTWGASGEDARVDVELELSHGCNVLHLLGQLGEASGHRRILTGAWHSVSVDLLAPTTSNPITWQDLRQILALTPRTFVPDNVREVVAKLPSKVMGMDVARILGIQDPNAGHYREIAETLRNLGWTSKRTNKGTCYFAPTMMGQIKHLFGDTDG